MKMARSKDGDGIKSALIIAEVQKRPILYDANHQSYGVRALKMQNWEEVCAAVLPEWTSMGSSEKHISGKEIQKRWRSIRDSYTKAYRQGKCAMPGVLPPGGGRRSQHQRQMSFLYSALQQKIPRPSTEKRTSDTEPASPQADPPLAIVKKEKERNKQEKEKTKQEKLNIKLEKVIAKHEKENNKLEKENSKLEKENSKEQNENNKQQKENNKQEKENNNQESTQNKVESRLPSIDTANTEDNKLIELKTILFEPKPAENTDMKTVIGANLHELKNANEIRNIIDRNPSLEIKIDANTILPEDHFDDDRLFMNSLLPFFKKMDDNTRLTCRIEVLKIIKYALQTQNKQNITQNNLDTASRPEEIAVKEEVKTSPDTSVSGVEQTPMSTASSLRMCRKRKASSPSAQSDEPGIRRRGPGRPRKVDYNITPHSWMRAMMGIEETTVERNRRRCEYERREYERRAVQRAERARKREEARTRDRLTPDEEEMYRATSVTQLKPPQFLKMYNLEPAKKPPVTPATALDAAAKKET